MKKFFLGTMTVALVACTSQPTPTLPPQTSHAPTPVTATATLASPSATIPPPTATSTRVPATSTPAPTPTRLLQSNEPPPLSVTQILLPEPNLVTATFTAQGNRTQVELNIRPSAANIAHTAVIYERVCTSPGILRYPLTNLVNGKSVTQVNASFTVLLSGALTLDIKRSTQPGDTSLACALIPEVWINEIKEGSQPGTIVLFEQAGGTEVDIFLKPGVPGVAQPAFLREGKCGDLGAIRYTLNPVVDGVSKTFFGTRFGEFRRERGAWNVHKSVQELEISTACGAVTPPE